ncbi:MAG TPA: pitrilysin family protein [Longimicrobium sp.]|nr:pitrilysin family protein [Longimicrobium sp.]
MSAPGIRRRLAPVLAAMLGAGAAGTLAAQDSAPPPPGPIRPFEAPRPQRFTLANGVRVVAVERTAIPIVAVGVLVEAGTTYEPARSAGLARLAASLLREGTADTPGPELARRLAALGAEWETFAGFTHAGVTFTTLSPRVPEALDLLAAALRSPAFPADGFDRRRAEAVAALEQRNADPTVAGFDLLVRALFAPGAPYGRAPEGERAGLEALARDDVVRWHGEHFVPARTTVVFVGAVPPARARALAEAAFGSWRAEPRAAPAPFPSPPAPAAGARVILVDRPGAAQTGIVVGSLTVTATDSLYFPLLLLNRVLGVGTSSRLNRTLRERRGFTYGVQSYVEARRGVGVFSVEGLVRTDATDSTLVELSAELRRLASGDVTAEELEGAVSGLTGSFPTSIATVQALRTRLVNLLAWDAPLDFYTSYRERLSSVDLAQVNAAARRLFHPERMIYVLVGDLRAIEAPVRALNLGRVEVWDPQR